jgi:hypothetical protein
MIIVPATRAADWNQASQLTFNQPVEVPGNVVLPAGNYWFVLADDSVSAPEIVQILDVDRNQVLATIKTIRTLRTEVSGRTELTFAEQSQTQPIALISWFYPGRTTGHEFVYPSSKEARLSENEHITVMAQPARQVQAG